MYPQIKINLKKLQHNTRVMSELCREYGISVTGVTKCFCAIQEGAQAMVDGGASMLADSRIDNLKKMKEIQVKKMLLRIPMHSEVKETVEYADYSLNSELSTLKLLGKAALEIGKKHNVVIMIDLGDLREGVWANNIDEFVNQAVKIDGISIKGFGVNLTCYGGVIPDEENLGRLTEIAKEMQSKYSLDIEILSGGNSSSVYLLKDGRIPEGINNLRLGEVILLGRETTFGVMYRG